MANKCGIKLRYPVKIVVINDDGSSTDGPVIDDAGTLSEAVAMAERQGFHPRDKSDGGNSRLLVNRGSDLGQGYFVVTVYPD
ncbi:hypothetical protein [Methylocaldum sp.]|uniref:hypothetical protein n=1 Tax=Methylocaldum sp. TaxID=1969727 RepID=UPI002D2EE3B5|nr:hypothetical protein [Methylocaldum sp.]HYE34097.1 hypothetical protein [Methylocaldum sp.]